MKIASLVSGRSRMASIMLCLMLAQLTEQLKFTSVQIPSLVQRGTNFWLSCQFELPDDDQRLYSVKWYKNNEEFYRLLQSDNNSSVDFNSHSTSYIQQGVNNQQQYFAQAGVNVMMSSSNATHVRLLNASLESEGVYACEISTQNLSTIRYEREIRVYVLPNSKLNIIGFKNRYALGDKVDLLCSTDYSRPRPAIAWFINGQRIRNSNQWFKLETQSKSKLNEPSLFRLNLGLKFKLSAELLVAFAASDQQIEKYNINNNSTTTQRNQGNQSHVKLNTSQALNNQQQNLNRPHPLPYLTQQQQQKMKHKQKQQQQQQQYQRLLQLKLQCKYKLTEVSDVTFNELLARQVVSQTADSTETSLESGSESESGKLSLSNSYGRKKSKLISQEISREFQNGNDEWLAAAAVGRNGRKIRRRRWIQDGNSKEAQDLFTITKSADNQVIQSKCPAPERELLQALARLPLVRSSDICRVGVSPLLLDDPLIVELDAKSNIGENSFVEGSSKSITSLSELTLSELEAESESESDTNKRISEEDYESKERLTRKVEFISAKRTDNSYQNPNQNIVLNGENINLLKSNHNTLKVNCLTLGSLLRGADEVLSSGSNRGSFCRDAFDRRRTLISGKYQSYNQALGYNDDFLSSPANTNQLRPYSHRLGSSNSYNNNNNSNNGNKQADLLSYLLLEGLTSGDAFDNATKQEQQAATELQEKISNYYNGDEQNLGANWPIIVADSSATSNELSRSSSSGGSSSSSSSSSIGGETQRWQLLAPPLLEWFINNQEAPKSSASYSPELPLLNAPPPLSHSIADQSMESLSTLTGQKQQQLAGTSSSPFSQSSDGVVGINAESYNSLVDKNNAAMLPSIDYSEYFANFDSRPIHQSLQINLNLNNKHFMTPDSKLRLRCSSTQALVILSEVATATIVATPGIKDNNNNNQINQQSRTHVGWQQRPLNYHKQQQHYHQRGPNSHQARSSLLSNNKRGTYSGNNAATGYVISNSSYLSRLSCIFATLFCSSLLELLRLRQHVNLH